MMKNLFKKVRLFSGKLSSLSKLSFVVFYFIAISISAYGQDSLFIGNKIKGLILGTLIGDALGGPIEFQSHPAIQATPNPPKLWKDTNDLLNISAIKAAGERIYFREYKYLRPVPEPYGHWGSNALPGTVTDDSRHKIILMYFLRNALAQNQWPVSAQIYAQGYIDWSVSKTISLHPGYDTLCTQWLDESYKAIRWLSGRRDIGNAYPSERLWNALPTCYGQMALPPIAAIYPGQSEAAYLAAYKLAWFDNGFAKDMIASLVAGLSVGLTLDPTKLTNEQLWNKVFETILSTDPYAYSKVPWSERAVERWFKLADDFAVQAKGSPAKLFALLEKEFYYTTKWEAQVPFVVFISTIKICNYDPLAALELSIEWGWDHDSYAQLLGAFVGAIYGPPIFSDKMRTTVTKRLQEDYDENIDEWANILMKIQEIGLSKQLFSYPE